MKDSDLNNDGLFDTGGNKDIFLCRHAHSDFQSNESFLYVIGKSSIM